MDDLEDIRETIKRLEQDRQNVTNVYEASKITPLVYFDGPFMLAALMWLSFVVTVFLVLFRQISLDGTTAAALVVFFLIAAGASMHRYKDN